jgi:hypothetical protein
MTIEGSSSNWEIDESVHIETFKILQAFQFSAWESKMYPYILQSIGKDRSLFTDISPVCE